MQGRERERERRTGHTVQLAAVTARQTKHHSAKRALIDPGDLSPSRMQAYGCRACAGVFGSGEVNPTRTSPLSDPTRITICINRAPEGTLGSM